MKRDWKPWDFTRYSEEDLRGDPSVQDSRYYEKINSGQLFQIWEDTV